MRYSCSWKCFEDFEIVFMKLKKIKIESSRIQEVLCLLKTPWNEAESPQHIELFRYQFFLFGILYKEIVPQTSQLPVVYMYFFLKKILTEIPLASTEWNICILTEDCTCFVICLKLFTGFAEKINVFYYVILSKQEYSILQARFRWEQPSLVGYSILL